MKSDANNSLKLSLEYDFYGGLLTKRQSEVMQLYHEENLSLSEIAEEFGISRQGVHDALKNAQEALATYEEKLGLVARFEKTNRAVADIDGIIEELSGDAKKSGADRDTAAKLKKIRKIIDSLND